jgi:hypothetical protein
MATILARDFLRTISTSLSDMSPQFTGWSSHFLVSAMNSAALVLAKYVPSSCTRVDDFKLEPGARQSIESIPPSRLIYGDGLSGVTIQGRTLQSLLGNMGDDGSTDGAPIKVVRKELLDAVDPDWVARATEGPVKEFMFDPRDKRAFLINPPLAAGADWWVRISYQANPVLLSPGGSYAYDGGSTAVIPVADEYEPELRYYVLAMAHLRDAEEPGSAALAQSYTTLFTNSLNALSAIELGTNPNLQALPMNPAVPASAR